MKKIGLGIIGIVLSATCAAQVQEKTILPMAVFNINSQGMGSPVSDEKGKLYILSNYYCTDNSRNLCGSLLQLIPPKQVNSPGAAWGSNEIFLNGYDALSGGLVRSANGRFYTTAASGANGAGYVIEAIPPKAISNPWIFNTIYNFQASGDASFPTTKLALDSAGNLYGASATGVFQLKAPATQGGAWTETLISSSSGNGLALDAHDNVFVTLIGNGPGDMVFELIPPSSGGAWTQKTLYAFPAAATSIHPKSSNASAPPPKGPVLWGNVEVDPVFDAAGNLYATDTFAGSQGYGCVFELSPTSSGPWIYADLFDFTGDPNNLYTPSATGGFPTAGLLWLNGKLYGTTNQGGILYTKFTFGSFGNVFELDPPTGGQTSWTEKIVHNFTAGFDGAYPNSGLLSQAGGLYGVTYSSGDGANTGFYSLDGQGTVYQVLP